MLFKLIKIKSAAFVEYGNVKSMYPQFLRPDERKNHGKFFGKGDSSAFATSPGDKNDEECSKRPQRIDQV